MASENQGLQIALIIFVMATVLLGVTTFMFFKSNEKNTVQAQTNLENEKAAQQATRQAIDDLNRLKEKVGFANEDDAPTMDATFQDDLQRYGGTAAGEDGQTYRRMLENMHDSNLTVKGLLAEKVLELESQKNYVQGQQTAIDSQLATQKTRADGAEQDSTDQRRKYDEDRDRITRQSTTLNEDLARIKVEQETALAQLQSDVFKANENVQTIHGLLEVKTDQLDRALKESFDVADGKIRWVNQREGTVWIDIGEADHVQRLTTFAVYPANADDLGDAVKKANIEVTKILGDHLSEAKISNDNPGDPVMLGDLLHSSVWNPGSQEHFALGTAMDVDGDDKSDVGFVRKLITMNGGVVDCWVDDTAMELKGGAITTSTRFFVVGKEPDPASSPEILAIHTAMTKQATQMGLQTISLAELLNRMGWKNQTPVIRYGIDSNPADFRPKPPAGVPQVSTGTVTDLFKKRTPPAPPRSAY